MFKQSFIFSVKIYTKQNFKINQNPTLSAVLNFNCLIFFLFLEFKIDGFVKPRRRQLKNHAKATIGVKRKLDVVLEKNSCLEQNDISCNDYLIE